MNCNQPIYLVPAPFPGESVSLTSKVWIELLKKEDVHALRANFEKAIKHAFDAEITILFPPEKLLHRSIMTKQEYARGAFNLEFTKQFDDHHFGHMNATYGQSILLTLFEETG